VGLPLTAPVYPLKTAALRRSSSTKSRVRKVRVYTYQMHDEPGPRLMASLFGIGQQERFTSQVSLDPPVPIGQAPIGCPVRLQNPPKLIQDGNQVRIWHLGQAE